MDLANKEEKKRFPVCVCLWSDRGRSTCLAHYTINACLHILAKFLSFGRWCYYHHNPKSDWKYTARIFFLLQARWFYGSRIIRQRREKAFNVDFFLFDRFFSNGALRKVANRTFFSRSFLRYERSIWHLANSIYFTVKVILKIWNLKNPLKLHNPFRNENDYI